MATVENKKIYKWNVDSSTWHPITDIPTQLRDGIFLSMVASDEYVRLRVLGGNLKGQSLSTALL